MGDFIVVNTNDWGKVNYVIERVKPENILSIDRRVKGIKKELFKYRLVVKCEKEKKL